MHIYPDGDHFPTGRSYRALMQQALAERNLGRMEIYFSLLEEAEQMLNDLRHSFGSNLPKSPGEDAREVWGTVKNL